MVAAPKWRRVSIQEVYLGLFDGPHATPKPSEEGPIFLGIGNISEDGHLDLSNVRHIAEEDYPRWTKRIDPRPGDIVFTYEATINRYAIIPDGFRGCLGRRIALIRPNPKVVDTRFLHYYFFGADWRATIASNILSGATVERIPLTTFPEFPVRLPSLSEQRRIASILSAYDDLIENNTRRIAILEEIARRIYEEWFVSFRFPGHEDVRMVESELGPVPEGWHIKIIGDMFDFVGGAQPPKAEHIYESRDGYVRFVQNRDYSSQAHLTYIRANKKNKLCGRLDIMIDKYGEAGKTRFGIAGAYNVALAKILPCDSKVREWLRGFLSRGEFREYLASASQAATRPSLNSAHFRVPVAVPPDSLMQLWQSQAEPLLVLVLNLHDANANLRTTRDLLLPKLISGELDVSELPEPEAVAA